MQTEPLTSEPRLPPKTHEPQEEAGVVTDIFFPDPDPWELYEVPLEDLSAEIIRRLKQSTDRQERKRLKQRCLYLLNLFSPQE